MNRKIALNFQKHFISNDQQIFFGKVFDSFIKFAKIMRSRLIGIDLAASNSMRFANEIK